MPPDKGLPPGNAGAGNATYIQEHKARKTKLREGGQDAGALGRNGHLTIYKMGHICTKGRLRQIANPLIRVNSGSFRCHCVFYAG